MPVERLLPDADAAALVDLAREIAAEELKPIASEGARVNVTGLSGLSLARVGGTLGISRIRRT